MKTVRPSPRLAPRKSATALYAVLITVALLLLAAVEDQLIRFALGFFIAAHSFQYWTVATARGERAAQNRGGDK